jgi:hypothetical protein
LPADTKLLIWNNKDFEPLGDIAILGGGAGASYDGSLEALSNASFVANGNEEHSIGGSFEFASNADFVAASSTFNFTTSGVGRNISVNNDQFNNLVFNGSGSWSVGDSYITVADNLTITSGDVTLPTGTTTIGGSMVNSGNLNTNNGVLHFVSNDSGESITLGGNDAADVSFAGSGSWTINDSNATITDSFLVATGTVTLPSGVLAVGQDFLVRDTINHNSGTIDLTNSAGETTLTLSGNDLFTLIQSGGATTTMTDPSASLRGDLFVNDGAFVAATNTLSIAGSLDVSLASFETSSGTILFNSDDTGEFIDPGSNEFNNVVIAGVGGGWTLLENATSTNNFTITTGSSFTLSSGKTLYVGGVFTNNLGGTATEWTGSTLALGGDNQYEVSPKTIPAENYETLVLGNNTDISLWNSIATTTVVPVDSSLYSQDHGNNNGDLSIYGEFTISTTSEYWSYGRDFDGTLLTGGSRRGVSVTLVDTAGINVTSNGSLDMVGDSLATTTVQSDGSGQYTFVIDGGNINWNTYSFRDIPFNGIVASSTPSITALSNGDFEIDQDGGTALRLSLETLDANPSLTIPNVRFARVLPANVGVNVRLSATSTNAWRFTSSYGNISGEDFDVDGITECGSVRWDDSSCLLTEQTEYRWRHDDGGIGVPDSE